MPKRAATEAVCPPDRGRGRWLVASFDPVSMFSLRMTHATSKGGKTLVVPTPYAVKMALIDVCFRRFSAADALTHAREIFDLIKWREVRCFPPKHCVVQNTFVRALDQNIRDPLGGPFRRTIVYREFAQFEGELRLAVASAGLAEQQEDHIARLFAHINQLGKRGGMLQFTGAETITGDLPIGYTVPIDEPVWRGVSHYAMVQSLDDFGDRLCRARDGFERISTFGPGTIKLGEHRILTPTAIPYRRRSTSRGFTWYERTI